MYTITHSPSKNGFVLNGAAPRTKSDQYELVRQGEKIGIREVVSNEYAAAPRHYSEWNNGAYGSIELALNALELLTQPVGGSGGGAGSVDGTYSQEIITTVKTFDKDEINTLSFQIITGTAVVNIGGNDVTYPLANGITGIEDLVNTNGLGVITITPAADSSVLLIYKSI